jgi:hypothetical protein
MSATIESKQVLGISNDRFYQFSTLLGSFVILMVSVVMMVTGVFNEWVFLGLISGLACITASFWQYIGAHGDMKDERMLRVSTYAITQSWFTSLMFIGYTVLFVVYVHWTFNVVQAVGYVFFIMVITMLAWLAYNHRKGDVEA